MGNNGHRLRILEKMQASPFGNSDNKDINMFDCTLQSQTASSSHSYEDIHDYPNDRNLP